IPKPRGKLPSGGDLFGDDDSEDGLFSPAPTKPLKSTGPAASRPKEPSPRIGKLQASLDINPAALLPGETRKPPPPHLEPPGVQHAQTAPAPGNSKETGVSFDHPVQADTLHNANKSRIKMTKKRRPPTRTARRLAAQKSSENEGSDAEDAPPILSTSVPPVTLGTTGANEKVPLPRSASNSDQPRKTVEGPVSKPTAPPDADDLFESGDLFEDAGGSKVTSKPKVKSEAESPASHAPKEGEGRPAPSPPSDSNCEDLFKPVKPSKKSSPVSFLDSQGDLFSSKKPLKRKAAKPAPPSDADPTVKDIFEDDIFSSEAVKLPPVKAKDLEANLFDDDVDIFADLAVKPKERSAKKKVEAKSIFDEDMDDIFMPNSQSKSQTKKTQPVQMPSGAKSEPRASSTFEDPLNAFEGQ
ncbi:PREDICTED: putative WASH complex subunit FAM21, partial [Gekko japonicus]|uniref:WASH complex subunit FAM21 n=1 Tax=Gekko japonicus TaxID=146911 RepID=A0ABM1KLG9_GEKJA